MPDQRTPKRTGRPGLNSHLPDDSPTFGCTSCGEARERESFLGHGKGRPRKFVCYPCRKADYAANREERIASVRQWQIDNPEKARAKDRAYYLANQEKLKAYGAAYGKLWNAANPGNSAERSRRRRQRIAQVASIPYTPELLAGRLRYYGGRCWLCGGPATEFDHVKPIMHGGADILANLRPACDTCNSSKGWKWPFDTHVHGMPRSARRPAEVQYIPLLDLQRRERADGLPA